MTSRLGVATLLAGLVYLSSSASAEQVFIDFKTLGTVTTSSLVVEDVEIIADDGVNPTTVFMLNLNGLGTTGGAADSTTDGSEALHFHFGTLVRNAAVHVGLANNLDADGLLGEATMEAYIGTTSLGVLAIDDIGWKDASLLFGVPAVTGFIIRANVDGNRIDAMRYATYWNDVGDGLAGTNGVPELNGSGFFLAGEPVVLSASSMLPNTTSVLVLGFSNLDAPFMGGVMVPSPDLVVPGIPTGPTGAVDLAGTWPAGVPAGLNIWFQVWVLDPAGPQGLAASNGLRATIP